MTKKSLFLALLLLVTGIAFDATYAENTSVVTATNHPMLFESVQKAYEYQQLFPEGIITIDNQYAVQKYGVDHIVLNIKTYARSDIADLVNNIEIYLDNDSIGPQLPDDALDIAISYIPPDILDHFSLDKKVIYPASSDNGTTVYLVNYTNDIEFSNQSYYISSIYILLSDIGDDGYVDSIYYPDHRPNWRISTEVWD